MKVKLLSGWSDPGGSTEHHINLTNLLNENGYDCTFYGPHEYHRSKCKSGSIQEGLQAVSPVDIVISHFLKFPKNIRLRKHILSCHETNLFPLKEMDLSQYDLIHYVSNWQRDWHGVNHPYKIIPCPIQKVNWVDPRNNIAGVVGSIDDHKQTHISIERALKEGYSLVKLFGMGDGEYYRKMVKPYVDSGKAQKMNFVRDKEEMYNQVSKVYSSSKRECLPMIQGECFAAGIPFSGLECNMRSESDYEFDDMEILKQWRAILK